MDAFTVIKKKLMAHPSGAADTPELDEILHLLYTDEDADIVQNFGFDLKPADTVAQRIGAPTEKVSSMMEAMARKGIAMAATRDGVRQYAMLPMMIGLYEYPLMVGPREGLDQAGYDRLRQLWVTYYDGAWGKVLDSHVNPTRSRILPIKMTIEDQSSILPFEQVVDFVQNASVIAVGKCACRETVRKCNGPIEACIYFNSEAQFMLDMNMGRHLSKEEAVDLLRQTEEAGLVHVASNKTTGGNCICNCCRCCCTILRSRIAARSVAPVAGYFCQVDPDLCVGCEACVDRCPTASITVEDTALIDIQTCLGCGLCASECPSEALKMVRREDAEPQIVGKPVGSVM